MIDRELAGQFVRQMFDARTEAHVFHLQTKSYSEHKALEQFYEGITDLADSIAENVQGRAGILEYNEVEDDQDEPTDSKQLLINLMTWIKDNRYKITDQSDIQNQIDGVVELISRTYYMIENLK